jgi:ribosomal protein S17E
MGRIKSTAIKRTARQLLNSDIVFTEIFDKNKKLLNGLMPSKPIKNKIAGYISRLMKIKKALAEAV